MILEKDLLKELAKGDRKATAQVYKSHYPTIMHWINNNGGNDTEAEDIFQEAMVVLFQKSQEEEFQLSCKLSTYLFAISKHLWYKKIQQKSKNQTVFTDFDAEDESEKEQAFSWSDDISSHEEKELHFEKLNKALVKLGEPCQSLLKAYYHQNKSMQEIAIQFGYTNPDNAKTQKYKCLNRLKKMFFNETGK